MSVNSTLLTSGIACVVAALIGGGLKALGFEFPLLESIRRQVMLGLFGGGLLVAAAYVTIFIPPERSFDRSPIKTEASPSRTATTMSPDQNLTKQNGEAARLDSGAATRPFTGRDLDNLFGLTRSSSYSDAQRQFGTLVGWVFTPGTGLMVRCDAIPSIDPARITVFGKLCGSTPSRERELMGTYFGGVVGASGGEWRAKGVMVSHVRIAPVGGYEFVNVGWGMTYYDLHPNEAPPDGPAP